MVKIWNCTGSAMTTAIKCSLLGSAYTLLTDKECCILHTRGISFVFSLTLQVEINSGGVLVSMMASSVIDRGFEPQSVQTKDSKIGSSCFFAKLH